MSSSISFFGILLIGIPVFILIGAVVFVLVNRGSDK